MTVGVVGLFALGQNNQNEPNGANVHLWKKKPDFQGNIPQYSAQKTRSNRTLDDVDSELLAMYTKKKTRNFCRRTKENEQHCNGYCNRFCCFCYDL
jgi:hypothetical protein